MLTKICFFIKKEDNFVYVSSLIINVSFISFDIIIFVNFSLITMELQIIFKPTWEENYPFISMRNPKFYLKSYIDIWEGNFRGKRDVI